MSAFINSQPPAFFAAA
jgi:hypothetical protein